MEEIDDYHVKRDTLILVCAGHLEHFLRCPVAQLRLPQTQIPVRKLGRAACNIRVVFYDIRGRIANSDPVIDLLRGLRDPFGPVHTECRASDSRIVPEKTVAETRHGERHAYLGVSLRELKDTALHICAGLLVLAHSEDLLTVVRLESHSDPVVASLVRLVLPRDLLEASALLGDRAVIESVVFLEDLLIIAVESKYSDSVDMGSQSAVADTGFGRADAPAVLSGTGAVYLLGLAVCYLGLSFVRGHLFGQSPVLPRELGISGGPHPKCVLPPGLDHYCLSAFSRL